MLWDGKIKRDAHDLARFTLKVWDWSTNTTFEKFAQVCRNQNYLVIEAETPSKGIISLERELFFTDGTRTEDQTEIAFHLTGKPGLSGAFDQLSLMVTGHRRYAGFFIHCSGLPFRAHVRAYDKASIGRDAERLLKEILRFPGFKRMPEPGDWRAWAED